MSENLLLCHWFHNQFHDSFYDSDEVKCEITSLVSSITEDRIINNQSIIQHHISMLIDMAYCFFLSHLTTITFASFHHLLIAKYHEIAEWELK